MYTITSDDTLRVFLPVIDTPHFLQLHASLDLYSDQGGDPSTTKVDYSDNRSGIFWLHKDTVTTCLDAILRSGECVNDDGDYRRLVEMNDDGWDFFFRVSGDNSLVMRALAVRRLETYPYCDQNLINSTKHIDRRPPTLLKQFTLLQSRPSLFASYPNHLHILRTPGHNSIIIVTSPPLRTYEMDLRQFMRSGSEGMDLLAQGPESAESNPSRIARLIRTPEGQGLAIMRETSVEVWQLHTRDGSLRCLNTFPSAQLVSVLNFGRLIVLYTNEDESPRITLYESSMATALASEAVPPLTTLNCLPFDESNTLIGITATHSILRIKIIANASEGGQSYGLAVLPPVNLPYSSPLILVVAIDPMAWSKPAKRQDQRPHDILMSLSEDGELVFWLFDESAKPSQWLRSGQVRTGKTGYRLACCSSAKKTALGMLLFLRNRRAANSR